MQQNFAYVFTIVTSLRTKSFEWIQRVLYVFGSCNDELEGNSTLQSQDAKGSLFLFLTAANNSGAAIHLHLCSTYGEENAMNLKNVQHWQLMFWEGRKNIHDNKHEGWSTLMLDGTVWCIHTLLKDDYYLTITDLWWEVAACFSHKASEPLEVHVLQQLEMWKVCMCWVPQQSVEEHRKKITREQYSTFSLSTGRMEMIYSSE